MSGIKDVISAIYLFFMGCEVREKADVRSSLVHCEVRDVCLFLTESNFYSEGELREAVRTSTGKCR